MRRETGSEERKAMNIQQWVLRRMSDEDLELLADEIKYVREWRTHNQNILNEDGPDRSAEAKG